MCRIALRVVTTWVCEFHSLVKVEWKAKDFTGLPSHLKIHLLNIVTKDSFNINVYGNFYMYTNITTHLGM